MSNKKRSSKMTEAEIHEAGGITTLADMQKYLDGELKEVRLNEDSRQAINTIFGQLFARKAVVTPFDMQGNEPNPTWTMYDSAVNAVADRKKRLKDYDDMDQDTIIASALDIYAAEAVQFSIEKGCSLWITSEDAKIKEEIDLMHDEIDLEDHLEPIARDVAKYGEDFVGPLYNRRDGVVNLRFVDAEDVEIEVDRYDRPIGYKFKQGKKLLNLYDFVHFKVIGRKQSSKKGGSIYGYSQIEPARRTWRQLRLLEDALVIYRLDVGTKRLVFYIDVGALDMKQSMDLVRQWERAYKKRVYYDPNNQEFISRHSPLALDSHIFWPVKKESQSKIEYLGGDANVSGIADLDYFKRKMSAALKIPMAYLGGDEYSSVRSGLARMDIQFARMVRRNQRAIVRGVNLLDAIHLRLRGIDFTAQDYQVEMMPISAIEEQEKMEALSIGCDVAGKMIELGTLMGIPAEPWTAYILKNVMRIHDRHLMAIGIDPNMAMLKGTGKVVDSATRAKIFKAFQRVMNSDPQYKKLAEFLELNTPVVDTIPIDERYLPSVQ